MKKEYYFPVSDEWPVGPYTALQVLNICAYEIKTRRICGMIEQRNPKWMIKEAMQAMQLMPLYFLTHHINADDLIEVIEREDESYLRIELSVEKNDVRTLNRRAKKAGWYNSIEFNSI